MSDILHVIMLNLNIIDEKNINYIEKQITKRLSEITNDFSNI